MKVLKIKARNLQDALLEAKRQLGEGATALHTKQYDEVSLLGLRRAPVVEILAAADTSQPGYEAMSPVIPSESSTEMRQVAEQIADLRHILTRIDPERDQSRMPRTRSAAAERLVRNGVSEQLADALVTGLSSEDTADVIGAVRRRVKCSGPIECSGAQARVALVGPTGAGKTTTAAKLAAQHVLVHKKKVALLTLDTYRVGAVEQLATYARILDAPLEVGLCPEDVEALIEKHRNKDLIIIDTVGRSQREKRHLDELNRMLKPARPTEVHLAVSSQASPAAQREAIDAFGYLGISRLLLTKLDECPQPGCLLDLAANSLLPFSYVTYGQEVPDDIAEANSSMLAGLVWEGSF